MKNTPNNQSNAERNKQRREYKKTHPNGKISKRLDESDVSIIKTFCKINLQPLRSVIDIANNNCTIFCDHEGQEIILGVVQKIVFPKTFEVLSPFDLYINRVPEPGVKPKKVVINPGTILQVSEDFQSFDVDYDENEDMVRVPRHIIVHQTTLRQVKSLMLVNEENGIGMGDGMARIDLVELISKYNESPSITNSRTECQNSITTN